MVVTTGGYLLVYPAGELPVMNRGRGVKLINIPLRKRQAGEEAVLVADGLEVLEVTVGMPGLALRR